MREVSIDMSGAIPLIDIKLWSRVRNTYLTASLFLDTGAAVTTISKDILHILGYDTQSKEKRRITTASGIEYVDEVVLDKLIIAGHELIGVKVYAHTFPQESFSDGVVGINVLSNFDLFISFQNGDSKIVLPLVLSHLIFAENKAILNEQPKYETPIKSMIPCGDKKILANLGTLLMGVVYKIKKDGKKCKAKRKTHPVGY